MLRPFDLSRSNLAFVLIERRIFSVSTLPRLTRSTSQIEDVRRITFEEDNRVVIIFSTALRPMERSEDDRNDKKYVDFRKFRDSVRNEPENGFSIGIICCIKILCTVSR